MRSFARLSVFIAVAATATAVQAQVTVSGAWVRGTVQGQTATGAYMQLRSADGATLLGADSPAAGIVEIHEMRMEGNTMRMRGVESSSSRRAGGRAETGRLPRDADGPEGAAQEGRHGADQAESPE